MIKVFIVASELGNINRGYEASLKECFDNVYNAPNFDFFLFKGNGEQLEREFVIPNISSSTLLALKLGALTRKGRDGARFVHELSYFPRLLVYIEKYKPDLIYLSGDKLAKLLFYWKNLRSLNYKIIFRNGGPMTPPYFYADLVQHITPVHYQEAIKFGEHPNKHLVLPTGFKILRDYSSPSSTDKIALRRKLNLPLNKIILLSVAAIDKHHKRIDYLIREVHHLANPNIFLMALGHQYPESKEIIKLGHQLLGEDNFMSKQLLYSEMSSYYQAADLFILTSLKEAFGRVYVEAMSYGLPCFSHDYEVSRYVLGDYGYFGNFRKVGGLSSLLSNCLPEALNDSRSQDRIHSVYDRFSWDVLYSEYIQMFTNCLT